MSTYSLTKQRIPIGAFLVTCLVLGSILLVLPRAGAAVGATQLPGATRSPLLVIENAGQWDPEARFLLQYSSGVVWLTSDALWITTLDTDELLQAEEAWLEGQPEKTAIAAASVRLSFVGANPAPAIEPFTRLSTRVSYLLGNDPGAWRAAVPVWAGVRYRDLYPGVDLLISSGNGASMPGALPWQLEVHSGADLRDVKLQVEGADAAAVRDGSVQITTGAGGIVLPPLSVTGAPDLVVDNEVGVAAEVPESAGPGTFVLPIPLIPGDAVEVPTLTQDATDLIYSSYLGGSETDWGVDTAVDDAGAMYVVGRTPSADFPTVPGSYDTTLDGLDAYVVKLNPAGGGASDLVYATFVGGGAFDYGSGIVQSAGSVYVAGQTSSSTFPTTEGAFDRLCGDSGDCDGRYDAYLFQLSADGTTLEYSTYLGGANDDEANSVAFTGGVAYLVGTTKSSGFPTTVGAYDRTCGTDGRCNPSGGAPTSDAFFVRLEPAGNGLGDLWYSTFLGGRDWDRGYGVALMGGDALVVGETWSFDFPGSGTYGGSADAFAARIDPGGNGAIDLVYGRYLGGTSWDAGRAIIAHGTTAYVTGETFSTNFPVTTGGSNGGSNDAFLVALDGAGAITYAAYVGGTGSDCGRAIAADSTGAAVLAGYTDSGDFPVTGEAYDTSPNGERDLFVVRVDLSSSKPDHITYATYLGGSADDEGYGVALDDQGRAYLAGYTDSADWPTTDGAFDQAHNGGRDSFATKLQVALPPALRLEKSTNGLDADEPPGPYLLPGDPVTWEYVVANSGGFALNDIVVTDDQGVSVSCPGSSLLPEESMTCTASGFAAEGQYSNLGTATGNPGAGLDPAVATDPSHYFGAAPAIDLEKYTNGQNADEATGPLIRVGETVTWTYVVTNTGNVVLGGITVTDDLQGSASCPSASLAPHQSLTCILTATATADQYANSATVTGNPPGGLDPVTDSDPSHYYGADPAVSLEKHTNGLDADEPPGPSILVGDLVSWSYMVANLGNVPLSGVAVVDDGGVEVDCPETELAEGGSTVCTASGIAEAGQYANEATVTAMPSVGSVVTAQDVSHYFGVVPQVTLEKRTNGQDADEAPGPLIEYGGPVAWTYVVANTGNVPLTAIEVTDDQGVVVNCPASSLAVDESMTCTAAGTAISGQYGNLGTVTATATPDGLDPVGVSDTDPSHYFGSEPSLAIRKLTNGQDAASPPGVYLLASDAVTWTYIVTNTGNVALTGVVVSDDQPGVVVDCPGTSLAVDEAMTCTATGTAVAGQYANTGMVTGTPPVGGDAYAEDLSHYFGVDADIAIGKRTNGLDADEAPGPTIQAGTLLTWTYAITNTGNVALTGLAVTDDQGVEIDCPTTELAVGASTVCTATGLAIVGQYANTGTAEGTPPGGLPSVSASDASHYFGGDPAIQVEKTTNGQDADNPTGPTVLVDSPVSWEYTVKNVGNLPLSAIVVTDSDPDLVVECPASALAVAESMVCSATGTAETGQYSNMAVATGTPPDGLEEVSDSDPSHYFGINPGIDLEKRTNGVDADEPTGPYILVGDSVTWTYHVTNTGDILLVDLVVTDDQLGEISCPRSSLGEGQAMTCTVTGLALEGQQGNEGAVSAVPVGVSTVVTDSDPSHYYGASLLLTIEKETNGQDADKPPGPLVLEGGAVAWTYRIYNGSNVTLTEVSVTDNLVAPVTCPQDTLVAGESMTCTASEPALSGQYANWGTVSAMPPGELGIVTESDPSHYFGVSPSLALTKRTNGQDAGEPPGPYIWEGEPVTWTYDITNTGNITLTGLLVVDDKVGTIQCPASILAADESMTCQSQGVAELGQYANTAEVTGNPTIGPQVSASDDSHYFGISPSIEIEKYTNGWDADVEPWPTVYAGEVVTWTYVVTNTGDTVLTGIAVTDDQLGAVDCPVSTLDPSLVMTCEVTGTAIAGSYANLGTVVGTPPGGLEVSDSDPSHYLGRQAEPAIGIEKLTNEVDADAPPGPYVPVGESVTWKYIVTNLGNVQVTGITVIDSDLGEVTCPQDQLDELESMECVVAGSAVAGQYSNLATVTGTAIPGDLNPVEVTDSDPSHYFGSDPAIALTKLTNGQDADAEPGIYILAGEAVTWTYRVTNTGNVDLSEVSVIDDQGEDVSCPYSVLTAGATMTCTATGTAVAGQYANLATAQGTPAVGLPPDASDVDYYFGVILAATFEKRTNGQDADDAPGPLLPVDEAVSWTYHITSSSNVPLDLAVGDSEGVAVTCEESTVPPDGTAICSGQGTAVPGQYANTGSAILAPPGDLAPLVLIDVSHYYGSRPRVELEKHTNGVDADEEPGPIIPVGAEVEWTYHVRNTGNITLTQLVVTDDQGVDVSCPTETLSPDEEMVCTATGIASPGQYANIGSVTGASPIDQPVSATDPSHYFGSLPGIDLEKHTNGEDADLPPGPSLLEGQLVTWTYHVTNTGNISLTNVSVTDDQGVVVECPRAMLEAGGMMTCTASGVASAGQYANVGLARGAPPVGSEVSDSDPSHYWAIAPEPVISIQKLTNGLDADVAPGPYIPVGELVEWEYLVANAGNVPLSDITVEDDQIGVVDCPKRVLEVEEWMLCHVSGIASPGQYRNRGSVTATPPIGDEVMAQDDSHYFGIQPGVTIAKQTNGLDADQPPGPYIVAGEAVQWTYLITNSGNITLTQVLVTDDQGVEVSCPADVLGAGESMTCNGVGVAAVGQYGNVGEVTALPPEGVPISATDPSHYFGIRPEIQIEKHTNGLDADQLPGPYVLEGLSIEWTYVVSNTGDVELTSVTVLDDQGVEPDCPQTSLAVGEVMTCTASGTAEVGQYANIGTASGTHPGGGVVQATDPSHYLGIAIRPVVDVQKRTNGLDADLPPGPYVPVGDPVTWEVLVTNSGNVTLVELTVVDDQGVVITCPGDSLDPVESMVCTGSGVAVAGQYTNVVTATGIVLRTGEIISDTDPSHYFGSMPGIDLEKLTNGLDADEAPGPYLSAGEAVTWSYRVTNTGNVPLTGISVLDDQGVRVTCPSTTLGATQAMTCTATGQARVGQYVNIGSVVGYFGGEVVTDSDPSHYYGRFTIYLPLVVR